MEFRRLSGKGGPGSGRPSKLYSPRHVEIAASVPHREYALAADLMAKAIERASTEERPIAQVLTEVAREQAKKSAPTPRHWTKP